MPKVVFITGASSGIGRALAIAYAEKYAGHQADSNTDPRLCLGLVARRKPELESVKTEIEQNYKGIKVEIAALDVTAYDEIPPTLTRLASICGTPDVMVVNAGIGHTGKRVGDPGAFQMEKTCIETNVIGAMAVISWAIEFWVNKGTSGHIVGISSVAGLRGLPTSAAYCASKAALDVYLDALRAEKYGKITVTTIRPGYIDTPINEKMKDRPFLITVERGAAQLLDRIEAKTVQAYIPFLPWAFVARLMGWVPTRLLAYATTKM